MIDLLRKILDWLARTQKPEPNEPVYEEERPPAKPATAVDIRLSEHFLLSEFTRSGTAQSRGIDNTPGQDHLRNLYFLASRLEEVRAILGHPILISSGYRSPGLNRAVGGSATSDHANGLAVDFTCPGYGSVRQVCEVIAGAGIAFDQLIYEQGGTEWVHLGFGPRMRNQVMSWSKASGYVPGIRGLK